MPRPQEGRDDHTEIWEEDPSDSEPTASSISPLFVPDATEISEEPTPKSISRSSSPRPTLIRKIKEISIEHIDQTFSLVFSGDVYQKAIIEDCLKKAPPKTTHIAIYTRPNGTPTPNRTQSYNRLAVR